MSRADQSGQSQSTTRTSADVALAAARDRYRKVQSPGRPLIDIFNGTSAFYREISLLRRGKNDEARKLATEAAAKIKPLPTNDQNPLADGCTLDELILWMTYKEAKALIGLDEPSAVPAKPDGK